jgi:hypothetical protein
VKTIIGEDEIQKAIELYLDQEYGLRLLFDRTGMVIKQSRGKAGVTVEAEVVRKETPVISVSEGSASGYASYTAGDLLNMAKTDEEVG